MSAENLLLLGGAAAVGAYFLWPKAATASPACADPGMCAPAPTLDRFTPQVALAGMGQYVEFFECAYPQVLPDAMAPYLTLSSGGVNAALASEVPQQMSYHPGLGCVGCGKQGLGCGCGGGCAGGCGMGLFDSGLDFSQWGWMEWATVAFGVYVVGSVLGDVGRGVQRGQRTVRRVRRGTRKRSYSAASGTWSPA